MEAFGGGLSVPEICTAFMVAVTIAPTPGGLAALETHEQNGMRRIANLADPAISAALE